jgi:gliding motility-associated-like protein
MLSGNAQQLKFILASDVATDVTVSVNGTTYKKTYSIPAGGVITTEEVPRSGVNDARLRDEGLSNRGILIESKDPISATAFMDVVDRVPGVLMPTGTYAKSYTALGVRQFSGYPNPVMGTSWVSVIADNDNTVVEITPSGPTQGGRAAGAPFRVTLNRGEVYQILGAFLKFWDKDITGGMDNSYESTDLTGTTVVSVANASGNCYPVAVFVGSGGTGIRCEALINGADTYVFQQSYPDQAWGKYYLTAPLATRNSKSQHLFNMYRVMVKDPSTVVKRNGVPMTGLKNNYYEFTSRVPEYIEADKPVMVGEMMTYFNSCGNDEYSNPGSNEGLFYLTPISHGIKKATFYRRISDINYITVIVPTAGLASLKIDGSNTFDSTYVHPMKAGYTVVMKSWPSADGVSVVESDSAFTGLVHVPHNVQGYAYNIGYQVPRVSFSGKAIQNVYNTSATPNTYTCAGTPFKPTVYLPVMAKSLTWKLSNVAGISPSADITVNNPVPVDTVEIGLRDYYVYTLNQQLKFGQTGTYTIPVNATYSTNPQACDYSVNSDVTVNVITAPDIDYTYNYTGCLNADASFAATGTAGNGAVIDRWKWVFGDNTTSATQNPVKRWSASGNYNVVLSAIANDGCLADTVIKAVAVKPLLATPVITVDSIGIHSLKFKWNAVPDAVSYEVSTNDGNTWVTPSSGPTGLTHLVSGLNPVTTITLLVRANGSCVQNKSLPVSATTYSDKLYIPNAFTPNGDGLNDVFKVYAEGVKEMKLMIFNQWGKMIFETTNPANGWDGKHNGKIQPSGVYLYVCKLVSITGEEVIKKGNVNLVR